MLFAYLRNIILSLSIIYDTLLGDNIDLFIVDQIPISIPLLKLFTKAKILFYCHYPDLLLSKRDSFLKKLYRIPFDFIEEFCMCFADKIVVNSKYTQRVFNETFLKIRSVPDVFYPGIFVPSEKTIKEFNFKFRKNLFLSINRFEDKKNVGLVLRCLRHLGKGCQVIIAGGYDERVLENVSNLISLKNLGDQFKLSYTEYIDTTSSSITDFTKFDIIFMKNISSSLKDYLINKCSALIYTPKNEHFGIVPVEAMIRKCIVIALNSGGPVESIGNYETGFLVDCVDNSEIKNVGLDFVESGMVECMKKIIGMSLDERRRMGERARERAEKMFGFEVFCRELQNVIDLTHKVEAGSWFRGRGWFLLGLSLVCYLLFMVFL